LIELSLPGLRGLASDLHAVSGWKAALVNAARARRLAAAVRIATVGLGLSRSLHRPWLCRRFAARIQIEESCQRFSLAAFVILIACPAMLKGVLLSEMLPMP
jgi:hypothetical protein